jgi:hypothetical protein
LNKEQRDDLRAAAGFGLGNTKLDNDLINEAFILGAGFGVGLAVDLVECGPERGLYIAQEVLRHVCGIVYDEQDV